MKKSFLKRTVAVMTSAAITLGSAAAMVVYSPAIEVFAANADTSNYAKALQYSLYFYDANMCGSQVNENTCLRWRTDCHTYAGVNGGFHDAGDHVVFGLPQGYSASTLGWGYYEFSDAYEELGLKSHYKTISDYFCKYFKDCTTLSGSSVSRFCYQSGNGGTDHSYWGSPEAQSQSQWGSCYYTSNGASDIAAEYAAALALSYLNFGSTEDLTYAKALFSFANQYKAVATENCSGFYSSGGCNDDIAWAAGWLYIATNESQYLSAFNSNIPQYVGYVHCWDNVGLGCHILNGYINNNWTQANSYISQQVNRSNSSYWFLSEWGSARYNTALQLCALVVSKHTSNNYNNWAKWQMTYILGGNGAQACFISGLGDNSAKYPHHRAASGYSGWDGSNGVNGKTAYSNNGHTLIGALVGGPTNSGGSYIDSVNDYKANEVAVDYNAGCVGALAGLYSVYKTGSVVNYINDETIVNLDSTQQSYTITPNATNGTITVASSALEGDSVSFTTAATVSNASAPVISISSSAGTVSYSGSNGSYSFVMPAADVTINVSYSSVVYGDINGDGNVNATDASMALRYAVGTVNLSSDQLLRGDVNRDNVVNATDAAIISRYAVGTVTSLPI